MKLFARWIVNNVDAILAGADGKRSVNGGVDLEIKSKSNTPKCLAHVVKGLEEIC